MPVAADLVIDAGLGAVVDHRVADRADRLERQEHRDHEARVADAVGDERLLAGRRRRRSGLPERDQEVRAGADALPPEERDEQVLAEDEHQHREREQVEVEEELGELRVAVHVADRVQVDQRADAGDEQAHRDAQRIGEERHVDVQRPDRQPREQRDDVGPLLGRLAQQVEEHADGDDERRRRPSPSRSSRPSDRRAGARRRRAPGTRPAGRQGSARRRRAPRLSPSAPRGRRRSRRVGGAGSTR